MYRIGIIVFHNLRYAPFVKYYEKVLSNIPDISYEIIYYNRDSSLNEVVDENHIPIKWIGKGTNMASKIEKFFNFFLYSFKVKLILNHKKYDFLIILMTMPAVLINNYLSMKYRKKFILDIRDFTQEQNPIYFEVEKRLTEHSALNIISSNGFKKFLPQSEYYLCHNLNETVVMNPFIKAENRKIIISYIGSISYEKQCKKLIDLVLKDERFEFHFYGNENTSHIISNYVSMLKTSSICMKGSFKPCDKGSVYCSTDIVFNCYGNRTPLVKYAISNKYYDSACYSKPLLVSPDTIMAELCGEFGFPLDLDNEKNLNSLYNWYVNINKKDFENYCKEVIKTARNDNENTEKKIRDIILAEIESIGEY